MPRLLTETPIGYRIELDDGQVYDVDRNAAQNSFPDLFPSAGGTAYVGPDGQPPSGMAQVPQMPSQMPQRPLDWLYPLRYPKTSSCPSSRLLGALQPILVSFLPGSRAGWWTSLLPWTTPVGWPSSLANR